MALPLQPNLEPTDPRLVRLLLAGLLAAAILTLGLLQDRFRHRPEVLGGGGGDYAGRVASLVDRARERVWVMVYVLRPGPAEDGPVRQLLAALARARERGVQVRLVLDRSRAWGKPGLDPKHLEGAIAAAAAGVPAEIDDVERRSHAKVVLIDRRFAVVGSHNWTVSALLRNREASVVVDDPAAVQELEELFADLPQPGP